tara:strand:- start:9 stop:122 length:114 start_codon:yes stop_codon:yes gene_type:complete
MINKAKLKIFIVEYLREISEKTRVKKPKINKKNLNLL